jgi:Cof subfamily protein (haloacid dehalogenase superfamily)
MDDQDRRMKYRLLALDLDGTVIGRDMRIPAGTAEAIRLFQARGGRVTLATGRTVRTTVPFADELEVDGPLICYQGALVKDHRSGAVIYHEPVPPALAAEAVRRLLAAGVYVHAYIDDELYVPWNGEEVAFYQTFSEIKLAIHEVGDLAAFVASHAPTKLLFIADEDQVEPHLTGLQEHFSDRLHVVRSHAHFGELTAPGCTKGRALAQLAGSLGIDREAVAAIGDHYNDLEMVRWAGLGLAVRSAPPELIEAAAATIDGPEQAGLAAAIRRFLIAESPAASADDSPAAR